MVRVVSSVEVSVRIIVNGFLYHTRGHTLARVMYLIRHI